MTKNIGLVETTVLSLSYGRIVVKPKEKLHGLIPSSFETYQIVEPGNIIIRPTDLQNDWNSIRVGLSRDRGIITSAYICMRSIARLTPEYAYLLLLVCDLNKVFYGMGSGLRQNLDFSDFKRLPILAPPKPEQDAIAAFAEAFDQRIKYVSTVKRRLIELLEEEKRTVISEAVVKGVLGSTCSKESGIFDVGPIPDTWEVGALRRFWDVVDCKHLTVPFTDEGCPLASVREVSSFELDLSQAKRTSEYWYKLLISQGRKPKKGDLIYCRNASVGSCAYVNTTTDFAMGQDVCLIRSGCQNQRYLNYLLRSTFVRQQMDRLLVGSTFKRINISQLRALTVLCPPRNEQDAICVFLDRRVADIDMAISNLRRSIRALSEYRTALLTSIVTGKLNVRGVDLRAFQSDTLRFIEEDGVESDDGEAVPPCDAIGFE